MESDDKRYGADRWGNDRSYERNTEHNDIPLTSSGSGHHGMSRARRWICGGIVATLAMTAAGSVVATYSSRNSIRYGALFGTVASSVLGITLGYKYDNVKKREDAEAGDD